MAIVDYRQPRPYDRNRAERREAFLISCIAYPLLLFYFAVSSVLPKGWGGLSSRRQPRRSVFSEARSAVNSCIPFIFR